MNETNDNINNAGKSLREFLLIVAAVILAGVVISKIQLRIDLTEDNRYTLSEPSKRILGELENDVFIQVYLDGELPVPLKRLRRSVKEMLDEFRISSGRHVYYEFINPAESGDAAQREEQFMALYNKGLIPVNAQAADGEGGSVRKMIFPGMIVNYNGIEIPVNILKNNPLISYEQNILHSVEGLEYEMIRPVATVTSDTVYQVAFIEGHGELHELEVADITLQLANFFTVHRGSPEGKPGILDNYAAIIVASPTDQFSEADKLVLDQYIMNGGRVLWLIEEVAVNSDSLMRGETVGLYNPLNIEDQLFRYGVRINPEVVQDVECADIRLMITTAGQKELVPAPWLYYPLLTPSGNHPVSRNLNKVKAEFANTIDSVGLDPNIKKTALLKTSGYTRTVAPPLFIRLKEVETPPDAALFTRSNLTVAMLLEGRFTSAFKNRITSQLVDDPSFSVRLESEPTKMIVVADGDIIRNEISYSGSSATPLTLGQDKYTGEMFGNRDFIVNSLNYLVDDNGLLDLRSREVKQRLLDRNKIKNRRFLIQLTNIAGPVLLVLLGGSLFTFLRRRKYTKV